MIQVKCVSMDGVYETIEEARKARKENNIEAFKATGKHAYWIIAEAIDYCYYNLGYVLIEREG